MSKLKPTDKIEFFGRTFMAMSIFVLRLEHKESGRPYGFERFIAVKQDTNWEWRVMYYRGYSDESAPYYYVLSIKEFEAKFEVVT